jgi:acetyltransferase
MKVVGPVHKSDVGGVRLNVMDKQDTPVQFQGNDDYKGYYLNNFFKSMLSGRNFYIGAKKRTFIRTYRSVRSWWHICGSTARYHAQVYALFSRAEARKMICNLKGYGLIRGVRGQEGVNEDLFTEAIVRVSALCTCAPEIAEMDLNPLLGTAHNVTTVDARIRISRT